MTTGPVGGAQPEGSGRRVASLPGSEPGLARFDVVW